jgi:hypothetical protein
MKHQEWKNKRLDTPNGYYRAPNGTPDGRLEVGTVLWRGIVKRGYDDHYIDGIREEGSECLCSGATFFGWVLASEVSVEPP